MCTPACTHVCIYMRVRVSVCGDRAQVIKQMGRAVYKKGCMCALCSLYFCTLASSLKLFPSSLEIILVQIECVYKWLK